MSWPTRAWFVEAFEEIDRRVRARHRETMSRRDQERAAHERAKEDALVAAILAGRQRMMTDIVHEGWYRGGEGRVRYVRGAGGSEFWIVDDGD
jgi:hypothetical protein